MLKQRQPCRRGPQFGKNLLPPAVPAQHTPSVENSSLAMAHHAPISSLPCSTAQTAWPARCCTPTSSVKFQAIHSGHKLAISFLVQNSIINKYNLTWRKFQTDTKTKA
jgi:hypothetical protein